MKEQIEQVAQQRLTFNNMVSIRLIIFYKETIAPINNWRGYGEILLLPHSDLAPA